MQTDNVQANKPAFRAATYFVASEGLSIYDHGDNLILKVFGDSTKEIHRNAEGFLNILNNYSKLVEKNAKLVESNRELLEIVSKIKQWRKLQSDVFTYANGDGNNFDAQLQTAINNAKNIQL